MVNSSHNEPCYLTMNVADHQLVSHITWKQISVHTYGDELGVLTLKMGTIRCPEMSVNTNLVDRRYQQHRGGIPKSRVISV